MASEVPFSPSDLVHPVYLDVPMMVSFLAAIEGGVSYEHESTSRLQASGSREREGGGRMGLPFISSLLTLEASGRLKQRDETQDLEELRAIRRHTEASLFNLLRHRLREARAVMEIEAADELPTIDPRALVQMSGEVIGNPLQQLLNVMAQVLPYIGVVDERLRTSGPPSRGGKRQAKPRSGGQQAGGRHSSSPLDVERRQFLQGVEMFETMRADMEQSHVADLVLIGDRDLKAVLTLGKEFLTPQVADHLLGGRFTVIGKVTRVLDAGESVNLARRTALGLAGAQGTRELIESFTADDELSVDIADPIVEGPAVQLLPLAVYA